MADIVMADDGISFDGDSLDKGPLGGAKTDFSSLARALAARGHRVRVRNRCAGPMVRDGVEWAPLSGGMPRRCNLYVANRSDRLLPVLGEARRTIFWIHNPAVVKDIDCVAERVLDGETGLVAHDDESFGAAAIRLLGDDALWQAQSRAALARQRGWGWGKAAAAFEELMA